MDVIKDPKRFGHHGNAFGFLRLTFASLVIVSHTAELIDGNRSREPLTQYFGTISFGELAVDGFFIISGALISSSYISSKTAIQYLIKRVARIYPAFLIASLICVALFASIGGANEGGIVYRTIHSFGRSLILQSPYHYGAFPGSHYQDLNGAMWTIAYEFRCYILVLFLGLAGLLKRTTLLMVLSFCCLTISLVLPSDFGVKMNEDWHLHTGIWLGEPIPAFKLTAMFFAGITVQSCQNRMDLRPSYMIVSFVGLFIALCFRVTAEIGVATFGAYIIFGAAALGRGTIFEKINNKNDISYGVYLYAWPIEKVLIALGFGVSFVLSASLTWIAAIIFGAVSWFAIERPVMRKVRSLMMSGGKAY